MNDKIYIASAGESVDSIALKLYGDERYAKDILISNPQISGRMMLTGGERLLIPEMQNTSDREGKTISSAPWKESASKTDSDDPKKILNLVNLVAASVQNAKQEAKNAAQQAISLYRKIQSELEEGKLKGQKGDTGEQGLTGPKGDRGQKGDQGEKGDPFRYSDFTPEQLEGLRGPQGIQGNEGKQGERGQAGPQGQQGIQGEPGIPGIYYGPVQPTDEHHPVWIDPEGEPWYQLPQEEIARIAQQAAELLELDVNQLKDDISNLRFGDPYDGVDLVTKFADEISGYADPGAWIRSRIRANNFDGIHVNDYIPFTTTNGLNFKARVAGIDPYYQYGDTPIGHHIDFICDELWPTLHPINPVNYNNGLIPTENVTSDGTATQYVLTKPMYGVEKVTLSGTDLTGWTYDKDTYTLTFSTAPAAGTMVVTGTSSEYPWLASDAYLYVNSLAGHVPNGTSVNPAIKRVDYTNDGIYHYLPDWLKAVIIEKRFMLNKRYSATGILSDENSWGFANLGKLWFPTEVEVYGRPVWGSKGGYGLGGSIQYPLFMGNLRQLKKRNGGRLSWWLLSPLPSATHWCRVGSAGDASYADASADWIAAPVCFRIG